MNFKDAIRVAYCAIRPDAVDDDPYPIKVYVIRQRDRIKCGWSTSLSHTSNSHEPTTLMRCTKTPTDILLCTLWTIQQGVSKLNFPEGPVYIPSDVSVHYVPPEHTRTMLSAERLCVARARLSRKKPCRFDGSRRMYVYVVIG